MNRTLRRPMFRLGGSAEGITSGLDAPNINASRQPYATAGPVQPPEDFTAEQVIEEKEKIRRAIGADPEKESMSPGSLSSLLTNFSLNLAAQPGGNLMGAIGRAGQPALKQFQESRQLERLRGKAEDRELGLEAYRNLTGLQEEKWKAYADIMEGGVAGKKSYEFLARDEKLEELQNEEDKINSLIADAEAGSASVPGVSDRVTGAGTQADTKDLQRSLEKNRASQKLITGEEDVLGNSILKAIIAETLVPGTSRVFTFKDYLEYKKNPQAWKDLQILAKGGRVGLAMGGTPLMEEMVEQIEETGPDQVADLTYNELRSRLPKQINNDIVALLANSKQALVEFANITTQQDVDNFNQLYNVDLVLPQEG